MTPTKLLIGLIIVVFAVMALGVWSATQWAAAMLGFRRDSVRRGLSCSAIPSTIPGRCFPGGSTSMPTRLRSFTGRGALAAASGFIGCATAIAGSLWRARQTRDVTTYGSSRWATMREVERVGLFHDAGVFLGRLRGQYLRHDGPEHVMAFAPTRSGKGIGLVVPTLLSWTGSSVIHDIKGENWTLTAGWRAQFSHAILFNPTDPRSSRYNPAAGGAQGRQRSPRRPEHR